MRKNKRLKAPYELPKKNLRKNSRTIIFIFWSLKNSMRKHQSLEGEGAVEAPPMPSTLSHTKKKKEVSKPTKTLRKDFSNQFYFLGMVKNYERKNPSF